MLSEAPDQAHWLPLETVLDTPADTSVDTLHRLLPGHVQEGVRLDSTAREILQRAGSFLPGGGSSVAIIPCDEEMWSVRVSESK